MIDVLLLLGITIWCLCSRTLVLVTLHTLLNAIICCFQLNTGWGADANRKVDYLGIDAVGLRSMFFVVMPNGNHREHLGMFCIVMPSIFVNCPAVICSPNIARYLRETPLVICGPWSYLLHTVYKLLLQYSATVSLQLLLFSTLCC